MLFQAFGFGRCLRSAAIVGLLLHLPNVANGAGPANDLFANAVVLSGTNVSTNGSNVGASKQTGEPNHAGDAGGRSVWWLWTSPFSGSVVMHTSGSSFDT